MSDIRNRILEENRIGKLKLLIVELNQTLSDNDRISGYSTYTLANIEDLRKLALAKLSKGTVKGTVKGTINDISRTSGKEVNGSMTVKELKAIALERGIYIRSKALKDEILQTLNAVVTSVSSQPSRSSQPSQSSQSSQPSRSSQSSQPLSPDVCLTNKPVNNTYTRPIDDYNNLQLTGFQADSIKSCLVNLTPNNFKTGGKGSYGVTFVDQYKGSSAVFKVVKFPNNLGIEGFKWECVLSKRASMLGVGPEVLETSICYKGKVPKFGVLVLGKCGPVKITYELTKADCKQIYESLVKLHENGISHRDTGIRNIMRSGDKLVIIDYGLSLGFSGPVPEEYKIWDHAYLSYDSSSYHEYLKTKLPKSSMQTIAKLQDDIALESLTVQYMPIEMIRTLGAEKAAMYFNNATTTEKAIIIDRKFHQRLKREGIPF